MFENNWLTRQWNAYKENRRIKAHHNAQAILLHKAIHTQKLEKINDIIEATERVDEFLPRRFNGFLMHSLRSDSLPTFLAVMALRPEVTPNYYFQHNWDEREVGHGYTTTPLFVASMRENARNIAKYVATHPEFDLNACEYGCDTLYTDGKGRKTEHYGDKPSVVAEKHGAIRLAEILLHREADALKAKALALGSKPEIT
jgi:hypothetical protein|tara:strand:+ start:39653 stop:40252 length:600 start_codon:yes stop_codon:yes gene_type:complete